MLHAIGGINLVTPYGYPDGIGVENSPNLFVPPVNQLVSSQDFTNAAWVKSATTASAPNVAIAPDGSMTATKLSPTAVTAAHWVNQTITVAVGDYLAGSIYFKADDTYLFGQLSIQDATQSMAVGMGIWMNTSGQIAGQDWGGEWGTAITYINGGGESAPNGYCRVWVVGRVLVGTSFRFRFEINPPPFLGNAAKGLYIWGAQLEKGYSPSLYRPT